MSTTNHQLHQPSTTNLFRQAEYLATFDQGIPLGAVIGATRNTIAVIAGDDSDA